MRAYTEELAAEVRARCAGALEVDVDDERVVVLRPMDQAACDRWINEGHRSITDANANAVTRALLWPSVSELDDMRRRYALLDGELAKELARSAGDPLGNLAIDPLNDDTPVSVLERAGLTVEQATQYAAQASAQRRRAATLFISYGPDEPPFTAVLLSPREADLMPLQQNTDEAKKNRAQAFRTLALGCMPWTNEGAAQGAFERRPALPLALYNELQRLGGAGALRARKRGGGRDPGAAPGP